MKNKTHIYMANMLIDDMRANKLNLPGLGACTPPSEVRNAVINNPGAFRAGSVGPDFYPDLFLGQGVIHPDNSGKWLDLMFKRLLVSVPSERDKNLAFTLGFMSHYAGDMFGHAYVNHYAGGWFPLIKDIPTNPAKAKIVIKHILVEEYMDQRVPANASMQLDPPINFIRDVFTCSDAHLLMKQMNVGDDLTNPLSKYIILRNDVHNDLLKTAIGVLPGVTQYVQNWEEDVDSGIVTWLSEWAKTAEIFSGSGSDKFKQVIDNLEKWFMLKFISMIGFPDFVGQVISFLDDINILGPIKDFLKQLFREIVIAIAKEALGELYTTLDEAIKAIESAFKDPKVYLDNGLLFAERNVSQRLDADFGNYGKESSSDKQTFHAVRQCLTMSKLCLIGTDNLNAIVKNASGTLSFKSSNYTPAARMGYITVKTGTASTGFLGIEGAGTDNNVYLGIRYSNGKKYEVLCDKPNYNDFEKGDEDTYPFIMPENVDLSKVSAITARMSGNTASGDWYCDWIEIKNSSRERLFRLDSDFWLSTGQNKEFSNFSKYYSIPSAALRIDPKIMNFLWSLDGQGKNSANPATQTQWEINFPFYTDTNLREKVFYPLFGKPGAPVDENALPARVMTSFRPEVHGFHFNNDFENVVVDVGGINVTTDGRCGGMAFAALDYYYGGFAIPAHKKDCLPGGELPVDSILAKYIYTRLFDSFASNGLEFILWTLKGDQDSLILGKGVPQLTKTEEFPSLMRALKNGPVALGLIKATSLANIGNNHQAVAYGAEYDGKTGEMTVYLYDNNNHDEVIKLTSTPDALHFKSNKDKTYRGFFVESYNRKTPSYFDIAIIDKLTAIPSGSYLPALGGALQSKFSVKNFGQYPSALHGLYVRVKGPSGENLDIYFGCDENHANIEPGQVMAYDKTCPEFGTTSGNYILQAGYCFPVNDEAPETHNVFNILCAPSPTEPPTASAAISPELVVRIGAGSDSPRGARYCINMRHDTTPEGVIHLEMHREDCDKLPSPAYCYWIGEYPSAEEAIQAARENYEGIVDGCYYCCREVHTM